MDGVWRSGRRVVGGQEGRADRGRMSGHCSGKESLE